jgi:hypothetical protein
LWLQSPGWDQTAAAATDLLLPPLLPLLLLLVRLESDCCGQLEGLPFLLLLLV